jgi:hypothetical protein
MPAKNKYVSRLQRLLIARDKTGAALTTTLTAAAAKGASAITVAAITNAADGDTIRIGSGDEMELNKINGAPSGSNIPLLYPLQRAHRIGEDVREMTVFDHGAPNEGGVDLVLAGESQDIQVSDRRLPLAQIRGYVSAGAEWTWPYFTLSTIIAALGALLTRLSGAGTVASPKQFITDGNELGEENNVADHRDRRAGGRHRRHVRALGLLGRLHRVPLAARPRPSRRRVRRSIAPPPAASSRPPRRPYAIDVTLQGGEGRHLARAHRGRPLRGQPRREHRRSRLPPRLARRRWSRGLERTGRQRRCRQGRDGIGSRNSP